MGLDQYAYAGHDGQAAAYQEQGGDWDPVTQEWVAKGPVTKPIELAYWRKHPNLQGWMEQLWIRKLAAEGKTPEDLKWGSSFNGVELELTWEEIDMLEKDIKNGVLAEMNTEGFFFGKPSDSHYYEQDLKFCVDAKAEIFLGFKVFYNSSW